MKSGTVVAMVVGITELNTGFLLSYLRPTAYPCLKTLCLDSYRYLSESNSNTFSPLGYTVYYNFY